MRWPAAVWLAVDGIAISAASYGASRDKVQGSRATRTRFRHSDLATGCHHGKRAEAKAIPMAYGGPLVHTAVLRRQLPR